MDPHDEEGWEPLSLEIAHDIIRKNNAWLALATLIIKISKNKKHIQRHNSFDSDFSELDLILRMPGKL
jgi:hypothetical protein